MATQKKIDTVNAITEKVQKAKVIIMADYRGIKHKQLEELRRNLKKSKGEFMIAKNRFILRSLGDRGTAVREALNNETAVLFAYEDEVAPLKELLKFFKAAGMGKTKAGLMGSTVMSDADVTKLATLPTREVLLGKLVRQLNAPIQGLHYALSWNMNKFVWALNAVKGKKS